MNTSIFTALNASRGFNDAKATQIGNISNAQVGGTFNIEDAWISQGEAGARYIKRYNNTSLGAIAQTGVLGDLAFNGTSTTGLFTVKGADSVLKYTLNGSFRRTKNDQFSLADGSVLMGWKFVNGKLDRSTSSLVPLDLAGVTSFATPTSKISLKANLKSSAEVLKGPGGQINIVRNKVTSAVSARDIIAPGDTNAGALHLGDQFTLTPSSPGTTTVFEYGGIAVSREVDATNQMYGASRADESFAIDATDTAHTGANLVIGDGITIQIGGGQAFTFTAAPQAGASGNSSFNSMASLAAAINNATGGALRARIGHITEDPRLYITAKDADMSLTFANTGGGSLVDTLRLDNVKEVVTGVNTKRFATLEELQKKISATPGIDAVLDGAGNLDFNASSALSTLRINSNARNIRQVYRATTGYVAAGAPDSAARDAISIQSNNHGLAVGDFVRLNGGNFVEVTGVGGVANALKDGIYMVQAVGNDFFAVGTGVPLTPIAAPAPALGSNAFAGGTPINFTYQKVDGDPREIGQAKNAGGILQDINVTVGARGAAGVHDITIDYNALNPSIIQERLQDNDIVQVTGSTIIRGGYYRVIAGGNRTQIFNLQALPGAGLAGVLPAAGAAAAVDNLMRVRKVTGGGDVAVKLESYPLSVQTGSAEVQVRLNINSKLNVGDIIAFRSLAANVVNIADDAGEHTILQITKDKYYTITSYNAATGIATITADIVEGANLAAIDPKNIGFENEYSPAHGLNNIAAPAAGFSTVLGPNAYIDYGSRELAAFGMTIGNSSSVPSVTQLNGGLTVTYDPDTANTNFSSGGVTDNVFTTEVNVIDSQGGSHAIFVSYGKVGINKWAVEIYSKKLADDTYEVTSRLGGQLAAGYLEFDGQGQLRSADATLRNLDISWNNGAVSSAVEIDWGAIGGIGLDGKPGTLGVVQLDMDNKDSGSAQNGKKAGSITDYYFDEDGVLYARFDNGENVPAGQIAVATFQNYGGLDRKDGYFHETADSEAVIFRVAGEGGAATLVSEAINGSGINSEQAYMNVIEDGINQMLVTRVISNANESAKDIIATLGR